MLEKLAGKHGSSIGVTCLIVSALLWGGEYVVAKDVLDVIPPNWSNAIRAFFTTVFAVIIWRKHFKEAKLQDWIRGLVCGLFFGMGSALQFMGLDIGNPPFGHFGEYSIRIWFKNNLENLKIGKNYEIGRAHV